MYSLSLSSNPRKTICVQHGFNSPEAAWDYLRKNYQAMDCMWVTISDVGQVFSSDMPEVVCVLQDGDSPRWAHIIKEKDTTEPEPNICLSSMTIRLTGNRTAELNESDKIDFVTPDEACYRYSIDELRMIVKLYDATRITNN